MTTVVTIGICVRNCERFLNDAIESVIAQDFPHELMEIVFVDDGSQDKTLQIIQDYVQKMDIRAIVFHTSWKGLGPARQLVLRNANGKYLLWVDGDEILSENYVRLQVDVMEKNSGVGITCGFIGAPDKNMLLNLELVQFRIDHYLFDNPRNFLWKTRKLPGTGGSTFRIKALKQVNGFDERITGAGEDMDIAKKVENANWSIKLNNSIFYEKKMNMSTLVDLWKKYFWYGYGSYSIYRKHRTTVSLPRMTPLAGFFAGFFYSVIAYRLIRQTVFFLLPFLFCFKMTAWCLGFFESQIVHVCFQKKVG